jgi:hypothetical protein
MATQTSTTKLTLLKIGPKERHWAHPPADRSWQRFWGTFELHPASGLYVELGSNATHLKNLARAFQNLPEQLQALGREWCVTFNFAELFTANGNASTFYADFNQRSKELISPHIEMGKTSLQPSYIRAHLSHELSHLYWRTRTEQERDQFRQFLRETCSQRTIEITEYVHEHFETCLQITGARANALLAWDKPTIFERWVEESFCDTIAVLVDPDYPSYDRSSTVDLAIRKMAICSIFGLTLPALSGTTRTRTRTRTRTTAAAAALMQ